MKSEIIQAGTPLVLGGIGLILGLTAMLAPGISEASRSIGINLAGIAIGAASGLSQAKNSDSANIRGDKVSIQSIQGKELEER